MTKETYTPGPWFPIRQKGGNSEGSYDIAPEIYRGNAIGMTFIHVIGPKQFLHPDFVDSVEANANLIAAAPDLLEACELALACVTSGMEDWMIMDTEEALRKAIAKAKGE